MTETIKTTAERPLRRRDRQLTEDEALQIVRHAPHAVLEGTASRITDARERKEAALLICAQHVPGQSAEQNSAYYDREGDTVEVWKMTVTRISGKSRGWDKIKPLLTRS